MGAVTYKDIYTLTVEEILKRTRYNNSQSYDNQTSRSTVLSAPFTGDGRSDASTAELIQVVHDLLGEALPSWIISGLTVTAKSPISATVTISSGKGTAGGKIYELKQNVDIIIPFDSTHAIFYLSLWDNRIIIDATLNPKRLTIAKIVVPKPGTTSMVQDTKDESWNAYIVNFKEYKLYGCNNKFEEDTIELLRDNISPILAGNLIGNIRLSEDLKITNTQGTVEIDSSEFRILATDNTTLAKFNRNGTFFYSESGVEVARFTTLDAKIGNILVTKNTIESGDFISGYNGKGFQIKDDGYAQFNNVMVRGEIRSSVFRKDEIQVSGGNLIVTEGSVLDQDLDSTSSTIYIKTASFSNGDVLILKNDTQSEYLKIISGGGTTTLTVTRNFSGNPSSYSWTKGEAVTNVGDRISLVASGDLDANLPYIDFIKRNSSSTYSDETIMLRIGNLTGLGIGSNNFGLYALGDMYIGDVDSDNYLKYDSTTGILSIYGDVIIGGKSNPPADVGFFSVQQNDDTLIFAWTPVIDSDLLYYEIRVGTNWGTGFIVAISTSLSYELKIFQLGINNFWIKARDVAGNYSVNATNAPITVTSRPNINRIFYANINLYAYTLLDFASIQDNIVLQWNNLYNNNYYTVIYGGMTTQRWDNGDIDWDGTVTNYDWAGAKMISSSFELISQIFDLGASLNVMFIWYTFFWSEIWGGNPIIEMSTSIDGITWTNWKLNSLGYVQCRYFKVRGHQDDTGAPSNLNFDGGVYVAGDIYNNLIEIAVATIKQSGKETIPAAGGFVTFDQSYITIPTLITSAYKASTAVLPIINPSEIYQIGFIVGVMDLGTSTLVEAELDYVVEGY